MAKFCETTLAKDQKERDRLGDCCHSFAAVHLKSTQVTRSSKRVNIPLGLGPGLSALASQNLQHSKFRSVL